MTIRSSSMETSQLPLTNGLLIFMDGTFIRERYIISERGQGSLDWGSHSLSH